MDADERKTGLYLLQALNRLGMAKLLPPQFVFTWETTNLQIKMAADEWQIGLYLLHALSRVGTARLSSPQFVSDWKQQTLQLREGCR